MGFVLSFLLGFFVLRGISGKDAFRPVDLFFSWGLGVGLASQLTFFSILFGGRNKIDVLFLSVFVIFFLIWLYFFKKKTVFQVKLFTPSLASFLIVLLPLVMTQFFIFMNLPYGDWDGWSLWNYRANSLYRSAGDWLPVYHNAIQGKHPWLLPHYIVWGWSFLGKEAVWIPAATAFLMSFSTVGLLVYTLASAKGKFPALLAAIYLISIPYFNWHAAGQYASIFVAFFLLGSLIVIQEYYKKPALKYAVLSGFFLAFLANSKDEGVLLTVLFLVVLFSSFKKQVPIHRGAFLLSFMSLMIMFLLTEFFMRSSMGLPFVNGTYLFVDYTLIADTSRWKTLVLFIWNNILTQDLTGGFFFLLFWAFFKVKVDTTPGSYYQTQRTFLKVFIPFILIYIILYIIGTTDLSWRLSVTAHRLFFIFYPTFVYLIFGILYKDEEPGFALRPDSTDHSLNQSS